MAHWTLDGGCQGDELSKANPAEKTTQVCREQGNRWPKYQQNPTLLSLCCPFPDTLKLFLCYRQWLLSNGSPDCWSPTKGALSRLALETSCGWWL